MVIICNTLSYFCVISKGVKSIGKYVGSSYRGNTKQKIAQVTGTFEWTVSQPKRLKKLRRVCEHGFVDFQWICNFGSQGFATWLKKNSWIFEDLSCFESHNSASLAKSQLARLVFYIVRFYEFISFFLQTNYKLHKASSKWRLNFWSAFSD